MLASAAELGAAWGDAVALVSPRDCTPEQLQKLAVRLGGEEISFAIDPQCYLRDADHAKLVSHAFWKVYKGSSSASLLTETGADRLSGAIFSVNQRLQTSFIIVPGLMADVDDCWFAVHEGLARSVHRRGGDARIISTLAVTANSIKDENAVENIIEQAARWPSHGYYVVVESPGTYLVDDPIWLSNILSLCSGLRLQNREVLVGYSSHLMLYLAVAKVTSIASGTWLNVRSFPTAKFYKPEEGKVSRNAVWFYCPTALSEYKLPFLDMAQRQGLLNQMAPTGLAHGGFSDPLFAGGRPTSVNWGQREAFRHYLYCLRAQIRALPQNSYDAAMETIQRLLDGAERAIQSLNSAGVFAQDRSFELCIDAIRSALISNQANFGPLLRRRWSNIT